MYRSFLFSRFFHKFRSGGHAQAARVTVKNHLSVLNKLYCGRQLPAWWHPDATKRTVKTSKIGFCDSGSAAAQLRLYENDWLGKLPSFDHLLESFIVLQLIAQTGWINTKLCFWHYRA